MPDSHPSGGCAGRSHGGRKPARPDPGNRSNPRYGARPAGGAPAGAEVVVRVRNRWSSVAAGVLAVAAGVAALLVGANPAGADGPGIGAQVIVTLGDSSISGEAGRWAGNTNASSATVDALGPTAYFDDAADTAETMAGCHRSKAAEVHIGGGVRSANLACSGARTATRTTDGFKPGIDFYDDGAGNRGQAAMLASYAATANVKMVVLAIGGNNFHFASVVQACITNFLFSSWLAPNYCYDDASVSANFTNASVSARTAEIKQAILNVRTAMTTAGYSSTRYKIVVQNYASPIPKGSGLRYSQFGYTRQSTGGCGFWNADADWANTTALPRINTAVANAVAQAGGNAVLLNVASALNGRRLCENTVGLLEEKGLASWQAAGAVDRTEWVSMVRTLSTATGPYQLQESLHTSYWGQLALRNCVRQAYNGGNPRGGTCSRGSQSGLNTFGEPKMTLG